MQRVMNKKDTRDGVGTIIEQEESSGLVLVMWDNGRTETLQCSQLQVVGVKN